MRVLVTWSNACAGKWRYCECILKIRGTIALFCTLRKSQSQKAVAEGLRENCIEMMRNIGSSMKNNLLFIKCAKI